jgi:hypothetical protein
MPRKVDATQSAIVAALRKRGAFVQSMASIGKGCVDILYSFRGQWHTCEVKNGALSPSQRKLTPMEADWIAAAQAPVYLIENEAQVDDLLMGRCVQLNAENE